MSQRPPMRPQATGDQEPIKYGEVFDVSGELANKLVAPEDASMMQAAETAVLGRTQKRGPAAAMQSAATLNERRGMIGHRDASDVARGKGVTVTEIDIPGRRIITEQVGGQVVGQYVMATPVVQQGDPVGAVTIGEALEATAGTAGNKPIDQSDAAAIQAAEVRGTGSNVISPGGLVATAQSAATYNASVNRDEDKIKLRDVLSGATGKLPADKAATRQDAEGVVSAELRNNPNLSTHPGGVAAAVTVAARLNEQNMNM